MNKSNLSKHIKDNLDHAFNWSMLANTPKNIFQRSPRGVLHCSGKTYT